MNEFLRTAFLHFGTAAWKGDSDTMASTNCTVQKQVFRSGGGYRVPAKKRRYSGYCDSVHVKRVGVQKLSMHAI